MRWLLAALAAPHEGALTALLIVQCVVLFLVVPLIMQGGRQILFLAEMLLAVFGLLLVALSEGRGATLFAALIVPITLAASAFDIVDPGPVSSSANHVGTILILLVVAYVVARAVFGPGTVTGHRIRGAIVLYLTAGLCFGAIFRLINDWEPGAFNGVRADAPRVEAFGSLLYFSFVTLTSVGYGDIVPVHPFARSMANLESVIGQLYPATLLARLVTLHLESRRRSRGEP